MTRKPQQHQIDKWRSQMSKGKRAEFDHYCRYNRCCTDIQRWLEAEGYKISMNAIYRWWHHRREIGLQAEALNEAALSYDGIETDLSLQVVEGIGLTLVRHIMGLYSQHPDKMGNDALKLISVMPSFLREIRSAASQKEDLRYIRDRAELTLAGAQRMADILLLAFKDTSYEDALKEAVQGAMLQIETEVRGQQ